VDPDGLHDEKFVKPSWQRNNDILYPAILKVHPGNVVWPADRVAVPLHQFIEKITGGGFYAYPVDVLQSELMHIDPDALQNAFAIVFPDFI